MTTPAYTVTNWAKDGQRVTDRHGLDLGLTIYHTPGHTPDGLTIWDPAENYLFVGDTLYEEAPIYFLLGSSVFEYSDTLAKLATLVEHWNERIGTCSLRIQIKVYRICWTNQAFLRHAVSSGKRVQLAAGHLTVGVDAAVLIAKMNAFLQQVMDCKIPSRNTSTFGKDTKTYELGSSHLSWEGSACMFHDVLETSCMYGNSTL